MISNKIRIAIVGPVSAGKSTVLNSLFVEQYSDMKIRRTTMLPQVYTETNDDTNNIDNIRVSGLNENVALPEKNM